MILEFGYCLCLVCACFSLFFPLLMPFLTTFAGPLPSLFGLYIATYVICEMAKKPILNPLPIKNRRKLYERLLRDLLHRESKLVGEQIKYVESHSITFDCLPHIDFSLNLANCLSMKMMLRSYSRICILGVLLCRHTTFLLDHSCFAGTR